jgi:hypothetical protein
MWRTGTSRRTYCVRDAAEVPGREERRSRILQLHLIIIHCNSDGYVRLNLSRCSLGFIHPCSASSIDCAQHATLYMMLHSNLTFVVQGGEHPHLLSSHSRGEGAGLTHRTQETHSQAKGGLLVPRGCSSSLLHLTFALAHTMPHMPWEAPDS